MKLSERFFAAAIIAPIVGFVWIVVVLLTITTLWLLGVDIQWTDDAPWWTYPFFGGFVLGGWLGVAGGIVRLFEDKP